MGTGIGRIKAMKKILLPLDGSEASLKAFMPAKSLAELLETTLCILHISEEKLDQDALLKKLGIKKEDLQCYIISQKTGDPAQAILEESEQCDYIVMGTHGETCDTTQKAGSIAIKVVENTYTPVLLIKPDIELSCQNGKWIPQKALIPLNGAPNSAQALLPAMNILEKTTAEIDLLHISSHKVEPLKEEGAFTAPYYEDYPQHEWNSWSKEFMKRFCPTLHNHNHINLKLSLSHGNPAEEILNFAKENKNDFIAIAWHGTLSHLRAATLKRVLSECPCPIMLIKIK